MTATQMDLLAPPAPRKTLTQREAKRAAGLASVEARRAKYGTAQPNSPWASVPERFWAKVQKSDDCWLWTGMKNHHGYGLFSYHGRQVRAHRIAFLLEVGPIPQATPCVLHRCDTPSCVRPDHLFLGTREDNNRDRDAKGRRVIVRGSQNGMARLTETVVLQIRKDRAAGLLLREISERVGVSVASVHRICVGDVWRHVGGPLDHYRDRTAMSAEIEFTHELSPRRGDGIRWFLPVKLVAKENPGVWVRTKARNEGTAGPLITKARRRGFDANRRTIDGNTWIYLRWPA